MEKKLIWFLVHPFHFHNKNGMYRDHRNLLFFLPDAIRGPGCKSYGSSAHYRQSLSHDEDLVFQFPCVYILVVKQGFISAQCSAFTRLNLVIFILKEVCGG